MLIFQHSLMQKWIGSVLILFCGAYSASAQESLTGRIFKINSQEPIPYVNVRNLASEKYTRSDRAGNYEISAVAGNTLIFSSAGYLSDTIILHYAELAAPFDVFLRPNIIALADVDVDQMNQYVQDSIKRRNDYAYLLNKKHPVKFMNEKRPGDAPGFNFSPIGYFSKKEKQKRELKKRIQEEDETEYIDIKFSKTRVAQLTQLKGDSLWFFMMKYRPSYAFCRKANNMDMFLYINDKFVLYKNERKK